MSLVSKGGLPYTGEFIGRDLLILLPGAISNIRDKMFSVLIPSVSITKNGISSSLSRPLL